jgi:ATP-dependent Lon protease
MDYVRLEASLIHPTLFYKSITNQKDFMSNEIKKIITTKTLPILPLRDVVIFPHMIIPLFVDREKSIQALEYALKHDQKVLLLTQKKTSQEIPTLQDLYDVGTMANLLQMLRLPDGTVKILVEGEQRCEIKKLTEENSCFMADVVFIEDEALLSQESELLIRRVLNQFEIYVKLNLKIPADVLLTVSNMDNPSRLIDIVASHIHLKIADRQLLLSIRSLSERLEKLSTLLATEIDFFEIEQRVKGRVKKQMDKSQREYFLNEQLKAIQKELSDDGSGNDLDKLEAKIKKAGMSKEALEKSLAELNRLRAMSPNSAEASVTRTYLECMVNVPWKKRSKIKSDLALAEKILNEEHYGLEKIKERILEYLAVTQRVKSLKAQVLCLVGPPGVGKTSLGQSIAKATGREFVRFALGGVRDEAEIRGHRRTYIGSIPGRIIQKMTKAGVVNPLFLLDEVDKMSSDARGDPASALLEVLDLEQNNTFNDHYLEVDYDLSQVMFIATANSLDIPPPLLDRMEVINLSGYTEDEKIHIASEHLIPKQMLANGVLKDELSFSEESLREIIRYYTHEAGVRNLEREIAKVCRKKVHETSKKKDKITKTKLKGNDLEKYLGIHRYRFGTADTKNQIGQVTGLAWTQYGGDLLTIEVATIPGKGDIKRTGNLASVMLESIDAAVTVVRSRFNELGINQKVYKELDTHFHVPEGAIKKDGPSAGVAMCVALASSLTHIPVRADVAMTGEITLRGEVLPIGGLKEKLLAALRGGIKLVIIPEENKAELNEIPDKIKKGLDIRPVRWIDEVFALALEKKPKVKKKKN